MDGATIYYTTDGTQPTASSDHGTTPVTTEALAIGTTVYAYAVFSAQGYDDSSVGSAIYVPENGSGTYGDVVFLDDREDHTWSYYSDSEQPIHSLKPADVKIKYNGNGTGTVSTSADANPGNGTWTANATGVQVNYDAASNQFIYLKTLERVDGTTSNNPSGRCAYTTIANPFQVRPVYANGTTDTKWRGFYGWRIKSIQGGKIYSAASGGTQYTAYTSGNLAVTNYLNAETTYYFAPDGETGMEVELEALWARAYVNSYTGTGTATVYNTAVGCERNFIVVRGNTNYNVGNNISNSNNRAFTISTIFPNGCTTNTGTDLATGLGNARFMNRDNTLASDVKVENIRMNGNGYTLYAEAHNFVIGRGVTIYNNSATCATLIEGLYNDASSDFKMRIESGTFGTIRFAGRGVTYTGNITAILGSDYDRAIKDNAKLKVNTEVSIAEDYSGGWGGSTPSVIGNSSNIGAEALHCTVKSGNYDWGGYGGAYQFYVSAVNSEMYGSRTLIIEGGVFADIAGGQDTEVSNTDQNKVMIRIKGGTINGAVYGAAQFAQAYGNRRLVITGGDFKGWIAGGANGTQETRGTLYGTASVYVGGKANVTGTNTVMNRAVGGNVFRAGCGYNASSTSGQVTGGTNVVIADEAVIQRGVYGGGSYGYTTATANVYILGGTVNCEAGGVNGTSYTANIKGGVFGGACQNQGGITNITMKDGAVNGGVYGGSNYSGTVSGLATVNVSGGTAENIFGGGLGSTTAMSSGTKVTVSGGTINNNVYGGGEEGTVTGNTEVTFSGGTVNDIYGAGKGSSTQRANITGSTTVAVSGGTVNGSVYGGGQNGTVAYANGGANNTNYKYYIWRKC